MLSSKLCSGPYSNGLRSYSIIINTRAQSHLLIKKVVGRALSHSMCGILPSDSRHIE